LGERLNHFACRKLGGDSLSRLRERAGGEGPFSSATHVLLETRLLRKLQILDDATSDADLRVPPGNHFEKLRGTLAGWHSIRVNNSPSYARLPLDYVT
jgi:hypothetical protein